MNDVASVRAEIKTWERTFRANEGREPSVDDIKKQPQIAQKYKLYKKLTKAAASVPPPKDPNSSQTASQSPSTPTRSSRTRIDHAPLAALNSRVVTSAAPLSSFNPFSPQKAKGKGREQPMPHIPQPLFNPFASPSKPKPQAQRGKGSLGLFPSLQLPSRPPSPPAPPSAVVRARKRLRGEQVSPSPSKEKRRKTVSQTTLSFPRLNFASKKSSLFNDVVRQEEDNDDAFIDDSPVKASTRKFSHLFDEAQPGTTGDIFGLKKGASSKLSKDLFGAKDVSMKSAKSGASSTSSQDEDEDEEATSRRPTFHTRLTSPLGELELSGNHDKPDDDLEEGPSEARSKSPLLPPSPPPASSTTSRAPAKGKRKASSKALSQRKKMKLAAAGGGSDDEGSASDNSVIKAKVKLVSRPQVRKANSDDDDLGPDFDPILDLSRVPRLEGVSTSHHPEEAETVEINLPDKFKEVLDLDPSHWEDHYVEEDRLVKGLIYGRRVASYDPKKGEIWDVGEDEVGDDEEQRQLIDDDWEGEPVPWEAAEL